MSDEAVTFLSRSPDQTFRLGEMLGRRAGAGDFLALTGELGGGKTLFTQGLALGLGVPEEEYVTSPTFTILNIHRGRVTLYHYDLFRISGPGETVELGLEEQLFGDGVTVVEWAERLGSDMTGERLEINFEFAGERERTITMRGLGKSGLRLLAEAKNIIGGFGGDT